MLDTRRGRDEAVVSVQGDVDLTTFGAVESALRAACVEVTVLVLDLRDVDFMDTSGLRLVISEQQRAQAGGYRFVRRASSGAVGVFAPFLGAYERGGWEAITIRLEPGDQLVLYTDGVIDTVGQVERFRRSVWRTR